MKSHPYNWKPVPHKIFRDDALAETINTIGFKVVPFLDRDQLAGLQALYKSAHSFNNPEGAIFYSVYSQDLDYRERMHQEIETILAPSKERLLKNYKTVLNGFSIKIPGKKSGFLIHQDTTGLDEFEYSSLSLWVAVYDVNLDNGAMCMVPYTQGMFSPYRGISYGFPFDKIHSTVRRFLVPVEMKAGEAIVFDNRVVHASLPNKTKDNRVAVISGIFPEEADFQNCYKEPGTQKIEIFSQDDDYILKYPRFMHNCRERPLTGEVIRSFEEQYPMLAPEDFVRMAAEAGLEPLDLIPEDAILGCNPTPEPDGVDRPELVPLVQPVGANPAKAKNFLARLFGR